jgi:hypothetical protein
MFSKEFIKDSCLGVGMSPTTAGFVSGAGGGVCQVSVMGPCTFLVTSVVTGGKQASLTSQIRSTWQAKVRHRPGFVSFLSHSHVPTSGEVIEHEDPFF